MKSRLLFLVALIPLLILAPALVSAVTTPTPTIKIAMSFNAYAGQPLKVNNASMYLNTTDSHYHVKGTVTNILHETTDVSNVAGIFFDKTTNTMLKSGNDLIYTPIDPGMTVGFDFDTGYTAAQANQFQYMRLDINTA